MQAPHQTRKVWLCNPGCFTSRWLIIYERCPFLHKKQHKRRQWSQFSIGYILGILWVKLFTLRARVNVYQPHGWRSSVLYNTKQPGPPESSFNKECLLTMQQFDALFIFLCPLENTHLQTYSHKGVTDSASHLVRNSIFCSMGHGTEACLNVSWLTVSMGVVRRPHAKNSRKMTTTAW